MDTDKTAYVSCNLCPRRCGSNRTAGEAGVCRQGSTVRLARAALHFWEEPCISGTNGSGAVFFCGCPLGCVFCQNGELSFGDAGKEIADGRLPEIYLELQEKGAHNINLVTAGHFAPHVASSVEAARRQGLVIPIVYNTGGYERVETLKRLEGIVDIYLPDFKYMDARAAADYSHAPDYPECAKAAVAEMVRQQPKLLFDGGLMKAGVMVRHLLLPERLYDAKRILAYLYKRYGNRISYSLMSQYTPLAGSAGYSGLDRRVDGEAYAHLVHYAKRLGITNGYTQERGVATESFIPHFDCEGV